MRRWIWRALLLVLVTAALAGTALAADGDTVPPKDTVGGVILTANGDEWTVTEYDGKTKDVVIPALYENKPVTQIAKDVFSSVSTAATNLNKVTIPGTVTTISSGAFKGCESLNTVIFQDYMSETGVQRNATIESSAFEGCDGLSTLTLSCNILKIEGNAFLNCKHLSSVVIPWGVKKIEQNAFKGCSDLQDITILDPVVDISLAFNLDSATLKTIHCVEGELYNKLVTRMKNQPDKLHALTGKTEPQIVTQASCTQEGSIKVSYTCAYKKEITEEIKDKDDNVTGTKVVDTLYCSLYGKTEHSETRKTSMLPHTSKDVPDKAPTCTAPGYTDRTICSVCGTQLSATEQGLDDHTYDEDSAAVERTLFAARCDSTDDGLILVTKKCSVCGYTPVCYKCEELELTLKEANAGLETLQKELADATAKAEAAQAAKDEADAALKDAENAVTKAIKAVEEAQKAITDLPLDATVEEKDAVEKAKLAAERVQAEAEIKRDGAKKTAEEAKTEFDKAEADKKTAENNVKGDTAVSTAQDELREHLENGQHFECAECSALIKKINEAATPTKKKTAREELEKHQADNTTHAPKLIDGAISGIPSKKPEHQWGEPEVPKDTVVPECGTGTFIAVETTHTCKICGTTESTEEKKIIDAAKHHKPSENVVVKERVEPTCTEDGRIVYEDYVCEICGHTVNGEKEILAKLGHDWETALDDIILDEPTCTETGKKETGKRVCKREDCPLIGEDGTPYSEDGEIEIIPALGHDWGNFEPDAGQDTAQAEDCREKTVKGRVSCLRECGAAPIEQTITIPGKLDHTWGEWAPDPEDSTKEIRTCTVCREATETRNASTDPGTTTPGEPDDPSTDDPSTDEPSGGDEPGTTPPTTPEKTSYSVNLIQSSNGSVSASRSSAESGDYVTLTVWADSGYELDQIWVTTASGSVRNLTSLGGNQYRFTMPASAVEVRVSFSRRASSSSWSSSSSSSGSSSSSWSGPAMPVQSVVQSVPRAVAAGQRFADVPASYWAAGEINWANQMGYMNGGAGGFNPDGNITFQQLWMVLARLTGSRPASMEDARRWAVNGGFAEGAAPNGSVSRHQLVTALYRCAHLMGSTNRNTTSLAGYPDSRTVPAVARDAFSWAVANGIISGNSSGRLDPNGTLTRAQFCVILYRFSQRI